MNVRSSKTIACLLCTKRNIENSSNCQIISGNLALQVNQPCKQIHIVGRYSIQAEFSCKQIHLLGRSIIFKVYSRMFTSVISCKKSVWNNTNYPNISLLRNMDKNEAVPVLSNYFGKCQVLSNFWHNKMNISKKQYNFLEP